MMKLAALAALAGSAAAFAPSTGGMSLFFVINTDIMLSHQLCASSATVQVISGVVAFVDYWMEKSCTYNKSRISGIVSGTWILIKQ